MNAMRKVQNRASVAPATVTDISKNKIAPKKRSHHKAKAKADPKPAVNVTTVHVLVLEKAKELADGDLSRLKIISATEVIVLNHA